MENSDIVTEGLIDRDDAENMISDDSSNFDHSVDFDSDDSADSEKEREEHYKLERRVVELRKELVKAPNSYNTHVEMISSLKILGEFDQLRHAREAMHLAYPLTEELWLDWLRDEIKLAATEEDKSKIEALFSRATSDYLSIDIWIEYIQFSLTGIDMSGSEGFKNIRKVMEEAIRHGGLHFAKGALLWDSYRDFEMALYQTTKGNQTENSSQAQIITQLFNRQLSVPLLDMERTWNEYNEWLTTLNQQVESHVKAAYDKAKTQMEKISPLEDTLLIAVEPSDKAAVYRTYLDLEINEFKDPARIQALYERVVADLPLYDVFWIDYCKFVDRQLKSMELTFAIYHRAVRNCPWNGPLWADYMYAAERYQKDGIFISGIVEKAFNAGLATAADLLAVWMRFIVQFVRKCKWDDDEQVSQLREVFTRAENHLFQSYEAEGDPECKLYQYWAYIEAKKLNNMEKARELWGKIMGQGRNKSAQWWLAYIQFERCHGNDVSLVRKLFTKGLNVVPPTDWPEMLVKQWLQFEEEEGDLSTYEDALLKCEARMKKVNKEREVQIAPVSEVAKPSRKRGKVEDVIVKQAHITPAKKPKTTDVPPVAKSSTASETNAIEGSEPVVHPQPVTDYMRHAKSVFLSNLNYAANEEDIRSALSSSGTIVEIRLVRDYKGRSKGFAYVEFSSYLEALEALRRDRVLVKGRPMYISQSTPDSALRHPVFNYQTTLEKNKLFVRGLPTSVTKEEVEQLFNKFGIVKDVRIPMFKTGVAKGNAYVDFEDEVSAKLAISKTDGMTFKDKVLAVSLSNPPPRLDKSQSLSTEKDEMSLGGGQRERRTQVSFIPNVVLRQTHPLSMPPPAAPKSNSDFRSMLLNKK